jgi:hypothetical protein
VTASRALPLLIGLPLLAGCATLQDDHMVDNLRYEAGGRPGWHLEIGDDIALRLGENFVEFPDVSVTHMYPERPARTLNGVRRWESTIARRFTIVVEARPGPCTSGGGTVFPDHVRVRTGTLDLTGCGGPVHRP